MSDEKIDRNKKIVADKESGLTYRQLAYKYDMSHNTIARIIYRMRVKKELGKL